MEQKLIGVNLDQLTKNAPLGERFEKVYLSAEDLALRIKSNMSKGVSHFEFIKADGTIREAFGTLKQTLIPTDNKGYDPRNVKRFLDNAHLVDGYSIIPVDKALKTKDAYLVIFGTDAVMWPVSELEDVSAKHSETRSVFCVKKRASNPDVLTYYDLVSEGFRSCTIANIITVY